jgi:2,3-dihydroxybenzoate decarboxylase
MPEPWMITLEEHIGVSDFPGAELGGATFTRDQAGRLDRRLSDIAEYRLPEMDELGIATQVLSLTTPAVQGEASAAQAVVKAARSNDQLAAIMHEFPGRFQAFASLACQDPTSAVKELSRCVEELGFCGAMINGHTGGRYLDHESYEPLWNAFERLNVPMYLHPRMAPTPMPAIEGYPSLGGAMWGWAVETASHVLRLVMSGLFDRHPQARLIIGHMGEMLPFVLWRLDDRWRTRNHPVQLELPPSAYIRRNIWVTTTGVEYLPALRLTVEALGVDRVLFSVDYPYQDSHSAVDFINRAPLSVADRDAICRGNAARLLGLD